jgi:aryl-alcohol dehydrogenase-like predicted oxidoreductase
MAKVKDHITQRPLGTSGLQVSAVSMGTVELGLDYGIQVPGQGRRPTERDAIRLLQESADSGINLFDTAPSYGEAENIVGRALGHRQDTIISTKIHQPCEEEGQFLHGSRLQNRVEQSLRHSLQALNREVLDVVHIHNATVEIFDDGGLLQELVKAKEKGLVRFIGCSVYQQDEALAGIQTGVLDVLQVAYNLLDQRMAEMVFPLAQEAGVGIMARSAYLKGVLTEKAQWLPSSLSSLRQAVDAVTTQLNISWVSLPGAALRFCLSHPQVATVLVGIQNEKELESALQAVDLGELEPEELAKAQELGLTDEDLLNPSTWTLP